MQYSLLYCKRRLVVGKCIAGLYCKRRAAGKLYRNTMNCIVTEAGHGLYCNTVTGPRHGAGQGAGRAAGRWGAQRGRGWAHMPHSPSGRAAGAALERGARGRRGARQAGLAVGGERGRQGLRQDGRGVRGALRHGRGARPRYGQAAHDTATRARPVRTGWASWASFGANAPGSIFDLVFRLGNVSKSPFGPGS